MLNTNLFLTGEVKVIKFFKYFTIILVFFGLTINTAYADPKKVGFIYIGPPGDHGWTYMHDVGRIHMEQQLGGAVTAFVTLVITGSYVLAFFFSI